MLCDTSNLLYYPRITPDNDGGFYAAWYEQFSPYRLFAQQVDSTGVIQWATDGFVVTPDSQVTDFSIVNDTQGNLYLAWEDLRNGDSDIFVQKFNSTGHIQYSEGGVALCIAEGTQESIQMVVSGQTPYCAWVDSRSTNTRIYLGIISTAGIANINNPASVITDVFGTETIDWTIVHPTTSTGAYRIMVYDWSEVTQNLVIDWTSWLNDTNLAIPINRTNSGEFTYIIQYYDDTSYLICQSEVDVTIVNNVPTIAQPTITTTTKYSVDTIDWIIDDDFSGGQYRIFANTTEASQSIYKDWTSWEVGVPIDVPIYREWPGFYNYSIEYYDNDLIYGVNASSLIEVVDLVPSTNSPADAAITEGEFYAIFWQIYDDYGVEKYQIWLNGSTSEETNQVWIDWIWLNSTQWGNKTFVLIPTNPAVGNYTYTLEFYTITGEHYLEEIFVEIAEPVVVDQQTENILDALTGPDSILFYGSGGVALVAVIMAISGQLKLKKLGNPVG